jgi:CheY-like chemotaxis protein
MLNREYRNTRFLIVDGNPQLRLTLERMLKAFGAWYIDLAADSHQAIQKSESGSFDVVICDFQLPGRNGQHVLEELRERKILRHTSLFVMMSAETTREMVLAAIDHQPDAYINKPVTTDILKQRLDALLVENEVLYELKHALDMDRVSEAISRCEEKIAKGSKYARWCEKKVAALYFQSEDYAEAQRIYKEVLSVRPLLWAQVGLARVHLALAEYKQAETLLRSVVETAPHCLVAYDLLAETLCYTGHEAEAQQLLSTAVSFSPTAILRHARLGKICWDNHDVENSVEAYRNAVELGRQSIFDCAENHLGFVRGLCERASTQSKEIRGISARQALQILQEASERFTLHDLELFQKFVLCSKALIAMEKKELAHRSLQDAETLYHHTGLTMPASIVLEYAQTLLVADKDLEAEFVLSQLTLMHGDDAELLERIEDIRDEPVSAAARQKAAALNRQGIGLAETGKLREAVKIFTEAVDYSHRHPALNLNLAQVLLKVLSEDPENHADLQACEACFTRVLHLKPTHKQYPRLQHLKEKFQTISV